jgi:hypothetical protein
MTYEEAEKKIAEMKEKYPEFSNENCLKNNNDPNYRRDEKLEAFIITYDLFKDKNLVKTRKGTSYKSCSAVFKNLSEAYIRYDDNPYKKQLKYVGWVGELYAAYAIMALGFNPEFLGGKICFNITYESIKNFKKDDKYLRKGISPWLKLL